MIEILGLALLANFLAWQFDPLQDLKMKLKLWRIPGYFGKLFFCHICIGFWLGWIVTGSLYLGLAISYLSHILKFIYDTIEECYHGE
jgi:hypothetical protein